MTTNKESQSVSEQDEGLRKRIEVDAGALGNDVPAIQASIERLLAQALVTAGLVESDLPAFKKDRLGVESDAPLYLRTLRDVILETGQGAGVERAEIEELTSAQATAVRKIRNAKEQIVLLARVSPKVDHRALNVNLGGSVAQTLTQVPAFLGLVRHSLSKFAPSERLPALIKEVEAGLTELATLETNQEIKKRKAPAGTRDVRRLAGLLYQTLSILSWSGQYLHYADPVRRDAYRLTLVRPPGRAVDAAPGDDEAVAPTPAGPRPVGESLSVTPTTGPTPPPPA